MTVPSPRSQDSLRSGLTIQSSFSCYLHVWCTSIPDTQLWIHSLYQRQGILLVISSAAVEIPSWENDWFSTFCSL